MRAGALALAVLAGMAVVLGLALGADAGTGDPPDRQVARRAPQRRRHRHRRPARRDAAGDDPGPAPAGKSGGHLQEELRQLRPLLSLPGEPARRASTRTTTASSGNTPPEGGFEVFQELHGSSNLAIVARTTRATGRRSSASTSTATASDDPRFVPAGWDEWIASTPPGQRVYDYTLNHDGRLIDHGSGPGDFKEDVLSDAAVRVIARRAPAEQPFFLTLAYTAPHVGGPKVSRQPPHDCIGAAKPCSALRARVRLGPAPDAPGFNEANVSDKPPGVRNLSRIGPAERRDLVRTYRCYLESLLAVDDGVGRIVAELKRQGELADTLIVFTSDNGLFFGEHRILTGKVRHYEPASRVPLVMRGPGVRPGTRVGEPVMNVDLAPTILEAAGADPPDPLDGRSLLPLAAGNEAPSRDLLLESRTFAAVRSARYVYVEHVAGAARGARELYDLRSDPGELRDLAGLRRFADLRRRLALRLDDLRDCAGADCQG